MERQLASCGEWAHTHANSTTHTNTHTLTTPHTQVGPKNTHSLSLQYTAGVREDTRIHARTQCAIHLGEKTIYLHLSRRLRGNFR
jgi:hypothetical protein